ncbi:MAG: RNA polymerase [Piptocephalis tieghemiana]|nr:MAG: RNA polymerase [Piptocephalis tieghemiana]
MTDFIIFSDTFEIKDVDRDGKKFDRVSRVNGRSESYDMSLTLDIHSELYPLDLGEKITLTLASSLSGEKQEGGGGSGAQPGAKSEAGRAEKVRESWRGDLGKNTLADAYEYVMHGKVYKVGEGSMSRIPVFISYGGLLMCIEGDYRHLQGLVLGEDVYLLLRK